MVHIREAVIYDASKVLEFFIKIDNESAFMLLEPGERKTTLADQQNTLVYFSAAPNKCFMLAEVDERVIGVCVLDGGNFNRTRHSATLVIGVEQEYWGAGVGSQLLATILIYAKRAGLKRLELTVRIDNTRAIKLYQKHGFEIEGIKRSSFNINNVCIDQYYMALLLQ